MSYLKKFLLATFVSAAAMGVFPFAESSASACPSCKAANELDDRKPRAYMYSILFMLAMPATVFTGFGISFYRLSRRANIAAANNEPLNASEADSVDFGG